LKLRRELDQHEQMQLHIALGSPAKKRKRSEHPFEEKWTVARAFFPGDTRQEVRWHEGFGLSSAAFEPRGGAVRRLEVRFWMADENHRVSKVPRGLSLDWKGSHQI
jgi:hypothetical protein